MSIGLGSDLGKFVERSVPNKTNKNLSSNLGS